MLNRAGTELWNSQALGQCNMAPPIQLEPSIEHPLSGVYGQAWSARYLVGEKDASSKPTLALCFEILDWF